MKGVWKHVKRIVGDHEELSKDAKTRKTHCCLCPKKDGSICYALIRVSYNKNKRCWNTTEALAHMSSAHPESDIGMNQLKKKRKSEDKIENAMDAAAFRGPLDNFVKIGPKKVKLEEHALAKTTRFYAYGRQHISKRTFEDPEFRGMLKGYNLYGGGKGDPR